MFWRSAGRSSTKKTFVTTLSTRCVPGRHQVEVTVAPLLLDEALSSLHQQHVARLQRPLRQAIAGHSLTVSCHCQYGGVVAPAKGTIADTVPDQGAVHRDQQFHQTASWIVRAKVGIERQ